MDAHSRQQRQGYLYFAILLAIVAAYSPYLLSFTVFDGFTTLSNDAANYVLTARKWSPYFAPSEAEVFTIPFQSYPPAFPALLAITGASESLWASHLVVSLCMLASLLAMGIFLGRQGPPVIAMLTLLAMCLIPGIITNSLGILSENLYLLTSLAALTVYVVIRERNHVPWGWNLSLLLLMAGAILTRSVGIALIAAFLFVPALDRGLSARQRLILPAMALISVVAWLAWELFSPQVGSVKYGSVLEYTYLGDPDFSQKLAGAWRTAYGNVMELLAQWNRYLFLNNYHDWVFAFSFVLLACCAVGLGLRAARLRLDAIYVLFYLGLVLVWPFEVEVNRFLHPIALIVVAQPVLYLAERGALRPGSPASKVVAGLVLLIVAHLVFSQWELFSRQRDAKTNFPRVAHSHDYYDARDGKWSESLAHIYRLASGFMQLSAERIPGTHVVAAVKHENYALLTDRKAVILSSVIPYPQQLCNLKLQNVDVVFVSQITIPMNLDGLRLVDKYGSITREVWPMSSEEGVGKATVLLLDKAAIDAQLNEANFKCTEISYEFRTRSDAPGKLENG